MKVLAYMYVTDVCNRFEEKLYTKEEYEEITHETVSQIIPLANYVEAASFEENSNWLGCLEAAGVDNWGGFDDARDIYNEHFPNYEDDE